MQDAYPDYYGGSEQCYIKRCSCRYGQLDISNFRNIIKLCGTDMTVTTCAYCDRVLRGVGYDPPPERTLGFEAKVPRLCHRDELAEAIAQRDKFRRKVESLALIIADQAQQLYDLRHRCGE